MSVGVLILVLLFGMLLFVLEVFIIPGTTVFGIIGLLAILGGVVACYIQYGALIGSIVLMGSMVVCGLLTWVGLKRMNEGPFANKEKSDSKVNEFHIFDLKQGDTGITYSALRPEGKAVFGDHRLVVTAFSGFIDSETPVEILKIQDNKIYVQPKIKSNGQ